jgi:pimeloyl-ACP methyl ester carboxylesterase
MSSRRVILPVVLSLLSCSHSSSSHTGAMSVDPAQGLVGAWTGSMALHSGPLGIDLHFTDAQGTVEGTFDVPVQAVKDLPLKEISVEGSSVHLTAVLPMTLQRVTFDGQLQGDQFRGTFTQGPAKIPFELHRGARVTAKPVLRDNDAYSEHFVAVENGTVHLAGTLTVPKGAAHPPAVFMVTGSGPQDRDETVMGVHIFAVLADALARHGVAVLRVDDRGVAESTGDFHASTTADFAADAEASLAFLRSRGTFGPVGILGHSEGGLIAPLVALSDRTVAFEILVAPPTTPFEQVLLEQSELIGRANGHPPSGTEITLQKQIFDAIRAGTLPALAHQSPPAGVAEADYRRAMSEASLPWFQWLVRYDPAPALDKLACPTLALFGSLDLQVPPKSNVPPLERLAQQQRDVEIKVLPGLNHLLQKAQTGSPSEYEKLEKTVNPAALAALTDWVDRKLPHGSASAAR